jgi:dolichol-phosphate mannosyltransferase
MNATTLKGGRWLRLQQFVKFCLVGGSGVVVDMAVLYLLADPKTLVWNVTMAKVCAAEAAMLNNFLWNELWTFRDAGKREQGGVVRRLLCFNAICGIGIALAVFFLHLFHTWFGFNLYVANFLAIILVTLWNFWMNALFNWHTKSPPPNI